MGKPSHRWLVFAILGLIANASVAWCATDCPQFYADEKAPGPPHTSIGRGAHELCFSFFAVMYSPETRTPLWSAEHLTAADVKKAARVPRRDRYHAEDRLPEDEQAENADYAHSGFDRGHMSPDNDMPTKVSEQESFSLSNMVPQAKRLNEGLWRSLEGYVRKMATKDGELYIVTGPVFEEGDEQLHDRVTIPSFTFKAIYDPALGGAAAYLATNVNATSCKVISIAKLRTMVGFNPFPGVSSTKSIPLPVPRRVRDQPGVCG